MGLTYSFRGLVLYHHGMTWELADRHGVGEELRVLKFDLKASAEKSVTLAQL